MQLKFAFVFINYYCERYTQPTPGSSLVNSIVLRNLSNLLTSKARKFRPKTFPILFSMLKGFSEDVRNGEKTQRISL